VIQDLIKSQKAVAVPGVFNPISALLAEEAGFSTIYLSGAAFTASMGLPDLGIITEPELREMTRSISNVTHLPLIVDIDTGFGGTLNVKRTAEELVAAGAAAVQIEDQLQPKKCGHLAGKQLISAEEMVQKIRAIKVAAPDLMVVGRTDARGVTGLTDAIARAKQYMDAGADIIFPEALASKDEFSEFRKMVPGVPLVANMTEFGKTPLYSVQEFESLGYQFILFPVSALRVANWAVTTFYRHLKAEGSQRDFLKQMQTREELYKTIRYADYETMDRSLLDRE
jgi:methylisocitrate lyase